MPQLKPVCSMEVLGGKKSTFRRCSAGRRATAAFWHAQRQPVMALLSVFREIRIARASRESELAKAAIAGQRILVTTAELPAYLFWAVRARTRAARYRRGRQRRRGGSGDRSAKWYCY
eukprot:3960574-Pleurochrysis_carterae.AAC.2